MSTNKQCIVPEASDKPDQPGFRMEIAKIPEVDGNNVLIKVLTCGICHSDQMGALGYMGAKYPLVPGHEVIGKVVKSGDGHVAHEFAEGTMVGVGWHGGHCLACEACTAGDFITCSSLVITGFHVGGGYQEYMVADAKALARVPEGMDPVAAAPLMCAGVTVFNALRIHNEHAKPPGLVAVVGIGGLGHLAIQYAHKMGYTVVAISRGTEKKQHALELGATHFIDSTAENSSEALKALGGAKIILCTATNSKVMADCIDGLDRNGKLVILGASSEPIPVSPFQLIPQRKSVAGHPSGTNRDSQDAMEFAHMNQILPKTVVFDGLDSAPDAYTAMWKGEYRVVVKVANE